MRSEEEFGSTAASTPALDETLSSRPPSSTRTRLPQVEARTGVELAATTFPLSREQEEDEEISPTMLRFHELRGFLQESSEEPGDLSAEVKGWMARTLDASTRLPDSMYSTLHLEIESSGAASTLCLPPLPQEEAPKARSRSSVAPQQELTDQLLERAESCAETLGTSSSATEAVQEAPRPVMSRVPLPNPAAGKIRAVFQRFKIHSTTDAHKDDLSSMLKLLGFQSATPEVCNFLAKQGSDYEMLDFRDVEAIMTKFEEWDELRMYDDFVDFTKGTGVIKVPLLTELLDSVGVMPFHKVIQEALEEVLFHEHQDRDHLRFDQVVRVTKIIRSRDCLTKCQRQKFEQCWSVVACGKDSIDPGRLDFLLRKLFLCRNDAAVTEVQEEVLGIAAKRGHSEPPLMPKAEAILWSRRFLEMDMEAMRKLFQDMDLNQSNDIDCHELRSVRNLGYSIQQEVIDEYCASALRIRSGTKEGLDFYQFNALVVELYAKEGFSQAELRVLREQYNFFDDNGNGELDTIELSNVLRYLGYDVTNIEDLESRVAMVDIAMKGELDFGQFLRLARFYREERVRKYREVFEKFSNQRHVMAANHLEDALVVLDIIEGDKEKALENSIVCRASMAFQEGALRRGGVALWKRKSAVLDFYQFVAKCDAAFEEQVHEIRRWAGFSHMEVLRYHDVLESFDPTGTGVLRLKQLGQLLEAIGFPLRTSAEREHALSEVKKARTAAIFYRAQSEEESSEGDVTLPVFIHLLRALRSNREREELERARRARAETRFTSEEWEQFRASFSHWLRNEEEFRQIEASNMPSAGMRKLPEKALKKDGIMRLLRALGLSLGLSNEKKLELKIHELNSAGLIDMADFLRLMRWMIDGNFCGIVSGSKSR